MFGSDEAALICGRPGAGESEPGRLAAKLDIMAASVELLDISGVVLPFGLMLCKAAMKRLDARKVLEIRLQDRDTLQDLLMIFQRSGDRIIAWAHQQD
jgi:hypothetical protein